jgi:UDP-N-acetylglucosamine 2-epimerase (non-hydrolysing)
MRRIRALTIFGTRPEVIKLAPVILEMKRRPERFTVKVCATAQHRQMLDQALSVFDVSVDEDLDIMTPEQSLAQVTARAVERLAGVIGTEQPDVVLVQGDTTTAFTGALASYYHQVKVGHVEAGLRTGNKYAPFPEELNRRLIGQLTDFHFAPTERARQALLNEGFPQGNIFVTGNTVIDALLWVRDLVRQKQPPLPEELISWLKGHPMVLITGHRRESFGEGFENICQAVRQVADQFPDVSFVYPVHLNPNVREPVNRILGGHQRILLIDPLPYEPFVWLMDHATVVLTDSGGVQEEAPSLEKPVLVMREVTERPEGIEAGVARLVGVSQASIAEGLIELLSNPQIRRKMTAAQNPYGDGRASQRIANILENALLNQA